ncbi:MAG: DUF5611 family protein [Thermoplasmata archaeon]|uniref:DUF5611 family protein n=1 Tax=Candidatus Sysuiplasma superficiale TaxID=2823368 RepID=A0A8J8CCP0_9ARCH|nr:DUF5611 family protein [Candidatus Sysuiplasma superficiale]MBX8643779.1 DUF5611 family protein [Candidatus Sysuiplasma superficiale]MCL4346603.1 DUF5611 family protein [Candidatus Thermoplasmatota archaeon]
MQEYDIKKALRDGISLKSIKESMQKEFGEVTEKDGHLLSSFGALSRIECWLSQKKKLCVETTGNRNASDAEAAETVSRYNRFLEAVTGYTSKERRKKAMKVK